MIYRFDTMTTNSHTTEGRVTNKNAAGKMLARYGMNGDPVTANEFIALEGPNKKKWTTQPHCIECAEPLILYAKGRAQGLYAARNEVTRRRAKVRPEGYNHHPPKNEGDAVDNCSIYYRNRPEYAFRDVQLAIFASDEFFDVKSKEANIKKFAEPEVANKVRIIERFLMKHLTGTTELSAKDEKDLKNVRKGLMTLAGLDQNWWLLPFMEVVFLGDYKRISRATERLPSFEYKVRYDVSRKTQKQNVVFANGERGKLTIPATITAGFKKPYGIKPMRNPETRKELTYPVTKEYAEKIFAWFNADQEQARRAAEHRQAFQSKDSPESATSPMLPLPSVAISNLPTEDAIKAMPFNPMSNPEFAFIMNDLVLSANYGDEGLPPKKPPTADPKFRKDGTPRQHSSRPSRAKSEVNLRKVKKYSNSLLPAA